MGPLRLPLRCAWPAALLLVGVLQACTPGTVGYQRAGFWNGRLGYSERALGEREYSVVARGEPATPAEDAARIALLRAARLAQERGFSHFRIFRFGAASEAPGGVTAVEIQVNGAPVQVATSRGARGEPVAVLLIRLLPESDGAVDTYAARHVEAGLAVHFDEGGD